MDSLPEGISLEENEWRVANDLIMHLESIPAFYYPELLEDQHIYLFRTTRLRWDIESDMRDLPQSSSLLDDIKCILAAGDTFQENIAKHSHPKGHDRWIGIEIPKDKLKNIVQDYRQEMAAPIARIVKSKNIRVHSDNFKATMLGSDSL